MRSRNPNISDWRWRYRFYSFLQKAFFYFRREAVADTLLLLILCRAIDKGKKYNIENEISLRWAGNDGTPDNAGRADDRRIKSMEKHRI